MQVADGSQNSFHPFVEAFSVKDSRKPADEAGLTVLKENTNTIQITSIGYPKTSVLISTPKSSYTFGLPIGIYTPGAPSPSSPFMDKPDKDTQSNRRLGRYSSAEKDLASSFRRCATEPTAHDLRVRTLEHVSAVLTAHANESRKRVDDLRELLSNRDIDPQHYESLQRERWFEERRQLVIEEDVKIALQHLSTLSQAQNVDACDVESGNDVYADSNARWSANLVKFLEYSRTQTLISQPNRPASMRADVYKRRTIDKVTPINLVSSSSEPNKSDRMRSRAVSMDSRRGTSRRPLTLGLLSRRLKRSQMRYTDQKLNAVAEDASSILDPSVDHAATDTDESDVVDPLPETPTTTTVLHDRSHSDRVVSEQTGTGVATIYRSLPSSSTIVLPTDIDVEIPGYAVELLSTFDSDISTPLKAAFPSLPSSEVQAMDSIKVSSTAHKTRPLSAKLKHLAPPQQESSRLKNFGSFLSIPDLLTSRTGTESQDHHDSRADLSLPTADAAPSSETDGTVTRNLGRMLRKRLSILRKP